MLCRHTKTVRTPCYRTIILITTKPITCPFLCLQLMLIRHPAHAHASLAHQSETLSASTHLLKTIMIAVSKQHNVNVHETNFNQSHVCQALGHACCTATLSETKTITFLELPFRCIAPALSSAVAWPGLLSSSCVCPASLTPSFLLAG